MRDFLPIIYPNGGTQYGDNPRAEDGLYNCTPWVLDNGEIGACPRNEFVFQLNAASSADDRGRGLATYGGEFDLYLDQTNYYYNGGNTDLTATSSPGYAGNTGFNEEYTGSFSEHLVSGVENLVIVNAGHTSTHASAKHGNIWYAADASSAPASISDANMPGNNGVSLVRGGASLDGYFFAVDITGKIYNSDLNDITAWSGDFLTAEREPDTGIYVGKHHDHVVYIGTKSIEFFYNAGNASGSPLARRQDVSYSVGCYYPNTVVEVGDVIYFVGTEKGSGWSRVYKLENFQLTPISDNRIDGLLQEIGGTYPDTTTLDSLRDKAYMSFAAMHSSPGLILTYGVPTTGFTYYFHQKTGVWSKWSNNGSVTYHAGMTGGAWIYCLPIVAFNGSGNTTANYYQYANGVIAREGTPDNDDMDDLGSGTRETHMKFARWDAGTDLKKRINWVRVITAPVATDDTDNDPSDAILKWFDYDKVNNSNSPPSNYTAGKTLNLNIRGAKHARLGTTRDRSFLLDWPNGHGPITVVKGLEIDYDVVGE